MKCVGDVTPTDQRIAKVEISSLSSVQINEPSAPNQWDRPHRKGNGRPPYFLQDGSRPIQKHTPSPSVPVSSLLESSTIVSYMRFASPRRVEDSPSESVGGGNKTNLPGPPKHHHDPGCPIRRDFRRMGTTNAYHRQSVNIPRDRST
jgi:hypothetical protein